MDKSTSLPLKIYLGLPLNSLSYWAILLEGCVALFRQCLALFTGSYSHTKNVWWPRSCQSFPWGCCCWRPCWAPSLSLSGWAAVHEGSIWSLNLRLAHINGLILVTVFLALRHFFTFSSRMSLTTLTPQLLCHYWPFTPHLSPPLRNKSFLPCVRYEHYVFTWTGLRSLGSVTSLSSHGFLPTKKTSLSVGGCLI